MPVTKESHLLDGSQTCSPGSPKVRGQHAGSVFSSSSPCWHNAEQWSPYSPSTSTLRIIMFLPPCLGKVGETKTWQLPTRKTPVCTKAVLNKSHRSMEAEADPSTSTPRLEDSCLPLLYSWKHLPQSTSPSRACPLSTLLWHFPHDDRCLQKPESNSRSGL